MSKQIFYAEKYPDTAPFVAELVRFDVDYEEIAILTSLSNLKQFIRLRDNNSALYVVKVNGYLGFLPCC